MDALQALREQRAEPVGPPLSGNIERGRIQDKASYPGGFGKLE